MNKKNSFVSDDEYKQYLINGLFDSGYEPVFNRLAYDIDTPFWERITADVNVYGDGQLQNLTFLKLYELCLRNHFSDSFQNKVIELLGIAGDSGVTEERFNAIIKNPDLIKGSQDLRINIRELNELLFEWLRDNYLAVMVDRVEALHKNRLSDYKRNTVRQAYREYEENLTAKDFIKQRKTFKFPVMMLDRVNFTVRSPEIMGYHKDIRECSDQSKIDFEYRIAVERMEHERLELAASLLHVDDNGDLKGKYTQEELDQYVPVDLEKQFNYFHTRSVLSDYMLTSKPRKIRDGDGWAYTWNEHGVTYRFRYDTGKSGRPVSLYCSMNMQRRVWWHLLNKYSHSNNNKVQQMKKDFEAELIRDNNYIPDKYVDLYLDAEEEVFNDFVSEAEQKFHDSLVDLLPEAVIPENYTVIKKVSQAELVWNEDLPIDVSTKLWLLKKSFTDFGLPVENSDFDTSMLVVKYLSDIDTNFLRWAYKQYAKTKKILRHEVQFFSEMDNVTDLFKELSYPVRKTIEDKHGAYHKGLLVVPDEHRKNRIYELAMLDLNLFKEYLFFKFHRRNQQIIGTEEHGFYNWRNDGIVDTEMNDAKKRLVLQDLLDRYTGDLPEWLLDVDLMNVLVDQEFLTRKFFRNLTDKQYRIFREDCYGFYVRQGFGKYQLIHDVVKEFRDVRNKLSYFDYNDLMELKGVQKQ